MVAVLKEERAGERKGKKEYREYEANKNIQINMCLKIKSFILCKQYY